MNEKAIRRPTGAAIIFLITSLSYFFTIFSTALMGEIFDYPEKMPLWGIIKTLLLGATNLFMSIILFSKKYNNTLIFGAGALLISSVSGLFLNITPYLISELIFYIILVAFTYIMIKMPETPIREKAIKLRFVIPLFQFVLILISTIQTMQALYENLTETTGAQLNDPMNLAIVLIPSILGAVAGFLPVLCYTWLSKWLTDPYEE